MNFNKKGHVIANVIHAAKTSTAEPIPLYLSPDNPTNSTQLITINEPGEILAVCPDPDSSTERTIRYVTGASGSGKSYWTSNYIKEYNRLYPFPKKSKKRKKESDIVPDGDPKSRYVYVISSLEEDKCFDSLGPFVRRIKIRTNEFLNDDSLSAESFNNSLVIFDDTDCIIDKFLKAKINGLLNSILETGRHFNVECIYTSHLACAGNDTKRILNESKSVTIFPGGLGGRTLKYLLNDYMGLSKHQIKRVKQSKSRAVTIIKGYPMCVVTDKEAYILPADDN